VREQDYTLVLTLTKDQILAQALTKVQNLTLVPALTKD
jgi:hypothetical protein